MTAKQGGHNSLTSNNVPQPLNERNWAGPLLISRSSKHRDDQTTCSDKAGMRRSLEVKVSKARSDWQEPAGTFWCMAGSYITSCTSRMLGRVEISFSTSVHGSIPFSL